MKGIEIKDIRPKSNLVNIGSLLVEQVFQFKDGGYGMIVDHDRPRTITVIYTFSAHCLDWLCDAVEVIPVTATLTIESGGVNP